MSKTQRWLNPCTIGVKSLEDQVRYGLRHRVAVAAILGWVVLAGSGAASSLGGTAELQRVFVDPPDDARINVRWWWFGPAVTRQGIEREMKAMKAGGIGGFEVQPTYPLAVDGSFQTDDGAA